MEISVQELRTGNLLHDRDGRLCKVDYLRLHRMGDEFKAPAILGGMTSLPNKPIPLTEEWLLKFGFSYLEYKTGLIGSRCGSSDIVLMCPEFMGEWQKYYCWGFDKYKFVELKYVHQLQNLYFVLCGKELNC